MKNKGKKIKIGAFVPKTSLIHSLDSRVKILFFFAYMVCIFLLSSFQAIFVVIALLPLLLTFMSKINPFSLIRSILPLIILFLIITSLSLFNAQTLGSNPQNFISFGFLNIYLDNIPYVISRSITWINILLLGALLLATTSPLELTEGLASIFSPLQKIGVPVSQLSIVLALALRFIPNISELTQRIATAQKLRGSYLDHGNPIQRVKAGGALFFPLTIASLKIAEQLSISLLSKNYVPGLPRTKWDYQSFKKRQKNEAK